MDKLSLLSLLVINLIYLSSAKVDITDLRVPKAVSLAANTDIILDCVYDVTNTQGLVIKWFVDKDEQVYQWIPATRKPQAMGRLRGNLDLEYQATDNAYTMYRAMKIREVTKAMAGVYTCQVSTFENEDVESEKMVVYQEATDIEMSHDEDDDTVICNAEGVFPKPKMNIYVKTKTDDDDDDDDDDDNNNGKKDNNNDADDDDDDDDDDKKKKKRRTTKRADKDGDGKDDDDDDDDNDDDDDDDDDDDEKDANSNEDEDILELEDDGTYNISSIYKYQENELKEPVVFICELYIPDTDYKVFEKISYVPETTQTTTSVDTQLESSIATNDDDTDSDEENGALSTSPVSSLVAIISMAFTLREIFI